MNMWLFILPISYSDYVTIIRLIWPCTVKGSIMTTSLQSCKFITKTAHMTFDTVEYRLIIVSPVSNCCTSKEVLQAVSLSAVAVVQPPMSIVLMNFLRHKAGCGGWSVIDCLPAHRGPVTMGTWVLIVHSQ